jgi:hypothetical protein
MKDQSTIGKLWLAAKALGPLIPTTGECSPSDLFPARAMLTIHPLRRDMSFIPLITGEHQNDGDVNTITEMDHPVQSVLGGMRVQRMSLVQSLRQYAFVYRGEFTLDSQPPVDF